MTFAGLVGKRDRRAPDKPETSRIEVVAYRAVTEDIDRRHGDRHHLLAVVDQMVEGAPRLFAICGFAEDGFHRIDLRAVPVIVEDAGELADDGTHDEYVHVDEVGRRAARKVFICDVASAHDGDRAVGDEELVVHPVIEPSEIADRRGVFAGDALSCAAKRIEQAYLDVRKRRQSAKHRVAACRVKVVHQQPHPHAAQCGVAQVAHQQAAGAIVLNQVVLDVERVASPAGKLDPGVERIETKRHEPKPRQCRRGAGVLCDPDQRTIGGRLQCR